jgi:hypothetical protein
MTLDQSAKVRVPSTIHRAPRSATCASSAVFLAWYRNRCHLRRSDGRQRRDRRSFARSGAPQTLRWSYLRGAAGTGRRGSLPGRLGKRGLLRSLRFLPESAEKAGYSTAVRGGAGSVHVSTSPLSWLTLCRGQIRRASRLQKRSCPCAAWEARARARAG